MKKAKWGAQALLFVLVLTAGLTLTAILLLQFFPDNKAWEGDY